MSKTIKKKLKIEGMHCTSCAMCIDMDLEDLQGVCNCKTSYAKGETEVEFDTDKATLKKIIDVIKKLGYKVTAIDSIS